MESTVHRNAEASPVSQPPWRTQYQFLKYSQVAQLRPAKYLAFLLDWCRPGGSDSLWQKRCERAERHLESLRSEGPDSALCSVSVQEKWDHAEGIRFPEAAISACIRVHALRHPLTAKLQMWREGCTDQFLTEVEDPVEDRGLPRNPSHRRRSRRIPEQPLHLHRQPGRDRLRSSRELRERSRSLRRVSLQGRSSRSRRHSSELGRRDQKQEAAPWSARGVELRARLRRVASGRDGAGAALPSGAGPEAPRELDVRTSPGLETSRAATARNE
jgi:hypothetical protein